MKPKIGYKGPQLPPLPSAPKTPMSGNVDTTSAQKRNAQKMQMAQVAQKNQAMQQKQQKMNGQGASGFTPQFSPEVKKGIQSIIDPTGANVGRQAVPMPRAPMMKKGGTTKLHSIKKSNKKSNW